MTDYDPAAETTFCAVHPDRETALRCNKCGRLMCAECAVLTPVGYRCRECVRQHDDKFYKGTTADYVIVFGVSAVLSALGLFVLSLLGGFLLFVILLALPVGGGIGEAALRLTGRRRGRYSGAVAAAGVVVGALALGLVLTGQVVFSLTFLAYTGIVAATVYGRFRLRI
ncbi:MAG: hypothetical protein BroJett033_0340 [Chloroflexota bacterium]|nr:MAG: hypothetical protein BroJett033_0340 [Chloroflexota bacterium]